MAGWEIANISLIGGGKLRTMTELTEGGIEGMTELMFATAEPSGRGREGDVSITGRRIGNPGSFL